MDETAKTDGPFHSGSMRHDKDPSLPCVPSLGLTFAALHRLWRRFHVILLFLSGTINNIQHYTNYNDSLADTEAGV